jgi:hypothetical protein
VRTWTCILIVVGWYAVSARAFLVVLDPAAADEAVAIGQSFTQRDRQQFHARYRALVARPPVDYVDVVTPFRRVVLAAEAQARQGSRRFGQRDAFAVLDAAAGRLMVRVELTFHPLHTYVGVPAYEVVLVAGTHTVAPLSIDRQPRFGARTDDLPMPSPQPGGLSRTRASEPMLGGTVVALFEGRALRPSASYDAIISELGKEVTRVRLALDALR